MAMKRSGIAIRLCGCYQTKMNNYTLAGKETKQILLMDIKGFELPVRQSMEEVIAIKKPKLAICVYHKPQDIVDIPLYLNKICPAYKLYLRHHTNWVFETVLYAVA